MLLISGLGSGHRYLGESQCSDEARCQMTGLCGWVRSVWAGIGIIALDRIGYWGLEIRILVVSSKRIGV